MHSPPLTWPRQHQQRYPGATSTLMKSHRYNPDPMQTIISIATNSPPSPASPLSRAGPGHSQDAPWPEFNNRQRPGIDNSRFGIQEAPKYASQVCNDDTPQQLSTNNGTFWTSSGDGADPPGARSCVWSITVPGDGASTMGPPIITLTFWTYIMLACGKDSLSIYDGPDTSSPLLAKLCGNYWLSNTPIFHSSGTQMTIVYQKAADSPVDSSFTAHWTATSACNVCLGSGRGTCKAGTCDCNPKFSGSVCQKEAPAFDKFTPRSQHSMAYDSSKDMVYITGGTSSRVPFMSDLLTFSFGIAAYGPVADIWVYDTKTWSKPPLSSISEKMPTGTVGASCVFFTANNQTRMAVFGGLNKDGVTMKELHFYDVETRQWSQASHQNSVGLSGASAVFHQETNSLYYFGGMINQTIRNTIPYQYSLDQELWFALAPRFDPLASRPVGWNGTMFVPSSSDGDNNLEDPKGDGSGNSTTVGLQNPAMYDALSGVWAPAALMGSDTVVIYGGMRPFGLGVAKDPSCFIKTMYLYDISCQRWASYEIMDALGAVRTRVNHTMILRPGAVGGSKTAYTAYIFGGFDGYEHNDVVNITIDIYPTPPKTVNRCRALNWCSKYDDCQTCNPHYCSFINGLCLFDTDKAKKPASSTAPILLGETADIPTNGTLQDLLTQRPELKPDVTRTEDCPFRIPLNVMTYYNGIIAPKSSLVFRTYIDAPDYDIQFDINSTPNEALVFRTLNVWEGFMNMYWRASYRLLDGTWEEKDGRSTLQPDDLPSIRNSSDWDPPVITSSGTFNIVELLRRYKKYSGLDGSPSHSALQGMSSQGVYFPASDPRRFSGYYIYSLSNPTDLPITISIIVNLLNRPVDNGDDKGSQLDLATLGFFMVGFILGVLLLIILGRKLRRLIAERDYAQWVAAEQRMLEEEEAEEERRAALGLQTNLALPYGRGEDEDYVEKKPMYRIVVGVQQEKEALLRALTPPGSTPNTLRHRAVRKSEPSPLSRSGSMLRPVAATITTTTTTAAAHTEHNSSDIVEGEKDISKNLPETGQRKSDFIRDLGASPPSSGGQPQFPGAPPALLQDEPRMSEIQRRHTSSEIIRKNKLRQNGGGAPATATASTGGPLSTLQRGLSLGGKLKASSSLKRFLDISRVKSEEKEVLTIVSQEAAEDSSAGDMLSGSESDKSMSPLSKDLLRRRVRNPIMVQPISVEPLPFHGGLVPNTRRQYRRYRRSLQRRQQQQQDQQPQQRQQGRQHQNQQPSLSPRSPVSRSGSASRPSFSVARSLSRRHGLLTGNSTRSQSSLREAHRAASRTALRSAGGSPPPSGTVMEMMPLGRSSSTATNNNNINNNAGGGRWQNEAERPTSPLGVYSIRGSSQDEEHGRGIAMVEGTSTMRGGGGGGGGGREPQEYEAGPLLAVNILIVFPGDVGSRSVLRIGSEEEEISAIKKKEDDRGRKVARSTDGNEVEEVEEEDRRSQNTLYNINNITLEPTTTHDIIHSSRSSSSAGTPGHSSQASNSSSNTSASMSKMSDMIDSEQQRLPPMAIGTVFVPDPVRWWAYKAQQQVDRRRIQRELRRMWARQRQQQLMQHQQQQRQKSFDSK
ncbi:MAG: hypothetical protein J3R72DRAFT_491860 [Linnemannia gamsii]|nr:MAG: hypothetical protein J3R72DRAFT_491860 [Linnemannia gamsii]